MVQQEYKPFEVDQHITAMSKYYVGKIGSKFYIALRDEKKIFGIKCPKCSNVYWPPRQTCGPCFNNMKESDMVEIGPAGVVTTFTKIEYQEPVMPRKAPFVYAIIQLDGATTGMPHYIESSNPDDMKIGMRVEAVFEDERKGNILDIKCFKPV